MPHAQILILTSQLEEAFFIEPKNDRVTVKISFIRSILYIVKRRIDIDEFRI